MNYIFAPPARPALPIVGADMLFPVHRVYCIGRNYAAHAREMGHDPGCEPPFFFCKQPDNLRIDGRFPYPPASEDVHHEIELVVALGSGGRDIAPAKAASHIFGYGVALDMTRRDLQGAAKKAGRPWDVGKAFDDAAPCSALVRVGEVADIGAARIWLDVNGERRQSGSLDQMIWSIDEQIAQLSRLFELRAGDVILTGTPKGVGPVVRGDKLRGGVSGVGELRVVVV